MRAVERGQQVGLVGGEALVGGDRWALQVDSVQGKAGGWGRWRS